MCFNDFLFISPTPVFFEGICPGCGLAMLRNLVGGNPIQVTANHGPGIEPCRFFGNEGLDA